MAKYLSLDKKQINSSGLMSLRRGDDWKVVGTVIDKYARYSAPLDLTQVTAATGFWPSATGGMMAEPFVITDAKGGQFEMDVAASDTVNVNLESATTIYATLQHSVLGEITVETEFPIIEIKDRGFVGP